MSFASEAREELARESCPRECCALNELAAALLCSGGIAWRGQNRYSLSLTATDAAVARHYYSMLKGLFGVICQIRAVHTEQFSGTTRYRLIIPDEAALNLLERMRLLDGSAPFGVRHVPAGLRKSCCKKAFVRGAFLLGGAAINPEKSYHLEIAAPTDAFASKVMEILIFFNIPAKKTCRKAKFVVYLKKAEDISDALALMGASRSTLEMENVRVQKEMHNRVNRQLNCDDSNIDRVMNTADKQISDILLIDEQIGLEKLPRHLREIAELRQDNPAASLAGLAELTDPPVGKSGVNLRLRRISEIARKLRSGEDVEL